MNKEPRNNSQPPFLTSEAKQPLVEIRCFLLAHRLAGGGLSYQRANSPQLTALNQPIPLAGG